LPEGSKTLVIPIFFPIMPFIFLTVFPRKVTQDSQPLVSRAPSLTLRVASILVHHRPFPFPAAAPELAVLILRRLPFTPTATPERWKYR